MITTMPWHKKRVFYDREAERRRRLSYRLDISILVASALLLVVVIAGLFPVVDFWMGLPARGGNTFRVPNEVPDWPSATQEICAVVGLLCIVYISVALNMRARH
jgi:hypothetical protein